MPAARRMTRQLPSLREFMPINETKMDVGKHPLAPPKTENGADLSALSKPKY